MTLIIPPLPYDQTRTSYGSMEMIPFYLPTLPSLSLTSTPPLIVHTACSSLPPTPGFAYQLHLYNSVRRSLKYSFTHPQPLLSFVYQQAALSKRTDVFKENQNTQLHPASSLFDDPTRIDSPTQSVYQSKRYRYKVPRTGYSSRFSTPFPYRKSKVLMKSDPTPCG